jgi:hypothetical protein
MLTVVVLTMPPPTIMIALMITPVVLVVVLVVPMSFVPFPAFAIVVVMRMRPVRSFIRRTLPVSPDPSVVVTIWRPISVDPNETGAGRRRRIFIHDRRWRGPDIHRHLC